MNKAILSVFALTLTMTIAACGGGGGGGGGGTSGTQLPTSAVVRIGTEGTPSNSPINGVQANLHLPAGVSVKATQNAPQTDAGVVLSTGADLVMGIYSMATGTVSIYVAKTSGIAVGEFATINCDIDMHGFTGLTDLSVTGLEARDTNGNLISGLTTTFSVTVN